MASAWAITQWWVPIGASCTILQLHEEQDDDEAHTCISTLQIKLTAEGRHGQKPKLQLREYSTAKNALVSGILTNWYFSQLLEPSFETTLVNCTLNYETTELNNNKSFTMYVPLKMIFLIHLLHYWSSHYICLSSHRTVKLSGDRMLDAAYTDNVLTSSSL